MRFYRISPSLMNAFSDWLNCEELYAKFWGNSECPTMTEQEFAQKKLNDVLSCINREPQPRNEAADRGTCLNAIIDGLLGAESDIAVWWEKREGNYEASRNGFHFTFDAKMVEDLEVAMRNGIPQYYLTKTYTPESCNYQIVLHGYADYIFPTQIWDLKTTGKYEGEKYRNNWQRQVYPVVALDSGDMRECDLFGFHVIECYVPKGSGKICGNVWRETYDVNVDEARSQIMEFLTNVMIPQIDKWKADGLIPNQTIIKNYGM